MSSLSLHYIVPGDDFTRAGEASSDVKNKLKKLGYNSDAIRRVAIAMYEAEINMVIHAGGGEASVEIYPEKVEIAMVDHGPRHRRCGKGDAGGLFHSAGSGAVPWASARGWGCRISLNIRTA